MAFNEFECRKTLLKQNPPNFTQPRLKKDIKAPGPAEYELNKLCGGKGYSHIRHAPAYSFGLRLPTSLAKPSVSERAPQLNTRYTTRKGRERITHSVIGEKLKSIEELPNPGPEYFPPLDGKYKSAAAYSIRIKHKEEAESKTQWTAPPNMYCPPMCNKTKYPAYSLKGAIPERKPEQQPTATTYNPNYDYVKKKKPQFSFGSRTPLLAASSPSPAPNTYCDLRFAYTKKRSPAPSFSIKHSPYLGYFTPQLLPETPCIGNK